MSSADFLKTVFEFLLVSFTLWGLLHEDKFVAFEETVLCNIKRRRLKVVNKTAKKKYSKRNSFTFN